MIVFVFYLYFKTFDYIVIWNLVKYFTYSNYRTNKIYLLINESNLNIEWRKN